MTRPMKYHYYTSVDAKTRASCLFGFALESRYPAPHPIMYGACPDDAETNLPGVLGVVTELEDKLVALGILADAD